MATLMAEIDFIFSRFLSTQVVFYLETLRAMAGLLAVKSSVL